MLSRFNKNIKCYQTELLRPMALLLMVMLFVSGCSDDTTPIAPKSDNQTDETSKTNTKSLLPDVDSGQDGYRVVENFNVGDNVYVRSMALDRKANVLWVGTSVGVLEVDVATRNMLNTYTRAQGLANEYVFGMLVDSKGGKWFGTNGGGISRFDNGQWKTYFPMHGLADYWVYSFTEQQDGSIWVGTWAGLNKLNPESGEFTLYLDELVNEWVYGLDVDAKNRVWIGTEGGINMYDGQAWQTWTHKEGLGAPNNDDLPLSDNTGLGTRSRHDLSVQTMGSKTYNPNYVFSLIVAQDQSVWAGTWGGGASHYDGSRWTNYTTKDGLAGNIVYTVSQDGQGHMWFGTDGGLSHYDGKSWYTFTKQNGLLDNNIYAIVATSDNDIWVGSRNGVVLLSRAKDATAATTP